MHDHQRRSAFVSYLNGSDAIVVDAWRAAGVLLAASKDEKDEKAIAQTNKVHICSTSPSKQMLLDVSIERLRDSAC